MHRIIASVLALVCAVVVLLGTPAQASQIKLYFSASNNLSDAPDMDSSGYFNPTVISGSTLYIWAKTYQTAGVWDVWNGLFMDINNVTAGQLYTPYLYNQQYHVYQATRWQLVSGDPYPPIWAGDYDFAGDGHVGAVAVNSPLCGLGHWADDPLRGYPSPADARLFLVGWVTVAGPPDTQIFFTNQGITRVGGSTIESIYFGACEYPMMPPPPPPIPNNAPDATIVASHLVGDLNCDGVVNAFDIDPFIDALTNRCWYPVHCANCAIGLADVNGDARIDAFDIDPFIELLLLPEP